MRAHIFKPSRRVGGKSIKSRFYSGRYKMAWEEKVTTVPLQVTDKRVAENLLSKLVHKLEMEHAGLAAPRSVTAGMAKPLLKHLEDFTANLMLEGDEEDE